MTGLEVSSSTLHRVIHRHGFTGKKIQLAKQKSDGTVVSSWLRSGSSSCEAMKQGVLRRIILPVLRYILCATVSRFVAKTLRISHRLQDSRNCHFGTPWNNQIL